MSGYPFYLGNMDSTLRGVLSLLLFCNVITHINGCEYGYHSHWSNSTSGSWGQFEEGRPYTVECRLPKAPADHRVTQMWVVKGCRNLGTGSMRSGSSDEDATKYVWVTEFMRFSRSDNCEMMYCKMLCDGEEITFAEVRLKITTENELPPNRCENEALDVSCMNDSSKTTTAEPEGPGMAPAGGGEEKEPSIWEERPWLIPVIAGGGGGLLIVLIVALVAALIGSRRQGQRRARSAATMGGQEDIYMIAGTADVKLKKLLHKGYFSAVYAIKVKGSDALLSKRKTVAKVLEKNYDNFSVFFNNEIELMRKVSPHINIVHSVGHNTTSGNWFWMMETAPCGDLLHHLRREKRRRHPLRTVDICVILIQMISGLEHLHSQGQLEDDRLVMECLCCKHVLLHEDLTVKLTGFGTLKNMRQLHKHLQSQKYTAHDRWLAPEVLNGASVSPSADVWSLGATMVEMFTHGQPPYSNKSDDKVKKHITEGGIIQGISVEYNVILEIIRLCMTHDRHARPKLEDIQTQLENPKDLVSEVTPAGEYDLYCSVIEAAKRRVRIPTSSDTYYAQVC